MDMNKNLDDVDVKRRKLIVAGLAGASVVLMADAGSVLAAEQKEPERKIIKEIESMIPGYPKVRLRENTYAPGTSSKSTMKNDMICECTLGTLEVTADGKPFTAEKGHIWVCKVGIVEEIANKGSTPAIMRVFDLFSA